MVGLEVGLLDTGDVDGRLVGGLVTGEEDGLFVGGLVTGDRLGLGVGLLDTGDEDGTLVGGLVAGAFVTGLRVVAEEGEEVGAPVSALSVLASTSVLVGT